MFSPVCPVDVRVLAPEAAEHGLERERSALGAECDDLAVEDDVAVGRSAKRLDDLGQGVGHLLESPGPDTADRADPVELDP